MRYLSSQQIYKLDSLSTEKYNIPSIILMENAGRGVAEFILKKIKQKRKIIFLIGAGKNGGDGLVAARYLINSGAGVEVLLLTEPSKFKSDTLLNYNILKKMGVKIQTIKDMKNLKKKIKTAKLIVDSILGIGLKGEVSGFYKDAIEVVNNSNKKVIAVDIPSGLDPNSGKARGCCIKANYTIACGFPKKGFKYSKEYIGKLHVIDVGYPTRLIKEVV